MQARRRQLLASSAVALLASTDVVYAKLIHGGLPWSDGQADPPTPVRLNGWLFFTPDEAACVEAIVDRLIPPDPETPGGKDAGCAIFIDRQLAGPYGRYEDYYMHGPFQHGLKTQGEQSSVTPAQHYRDGLAALDAYCKSNFGGAVFARLSDQQKDAVLKDMEGGKAKLDKVDAATFFNIVLIDTQQGFFADPIYGGNKDMCAWKMIGFPGTRYDYRDWVNRHNERFPLPPISIREHPTWGHS